MSTQIALLRAINVGGRNMVSMSDLRSFVEALGFNDVRSLLQTGNLVFRGGTKTGTALEQMLESEAERRLGLRTTFVVRTSRECDAVIKHNPFPKEADDDPGHLVVLFLKDAPPASAVNALQAAIKGPRRCAYWAGNSISCTRRALAAQSSRTSSSKTSSVPAAPAATGTRS